MTQDVFLTQTAECGHASEDDSSSDLEPHYVDRSVFLLPEVVERLNKTVGELLWALRSQEAETEKAKKEAWKYLTERDEALEMRDIAIQERDEALKDLNALKYTVMKDVFRPRSSNATKKF